MNRATNSGVADCWNVIGVRGDGSCAKLAACTHCRNCEVYAGAAMRNLQRPVTDGYREQWAAHLRAVPEPRAANDSAALVFRVGREWLALPASMIDSVAPRAATHRLPHRSGGALLGIANVGGKLRPAISLALLLGIDDEAPSAGANAGPDRSASARADMNADMNAARGRHTFARLVLVQWEDHTFALPVADLHGIVRYPSGALVAPAATINKGLVRFLTGVLSLQGLHIGVLDGALVGHQMAKVLR